MIIVLDPGHTKGYNHSNVVPEYVEGTRMFEYSQILKSKLEKAGFTVYTTRENVEENPSLADRGYFAGQKKADLLLSLHSNAPGSQTDKNGNKYYDPAVQGIVIVPAINNKPMRTLAEFLAPKLAATMDTPVRAIFTQAYPNTTDINYYGILRNSVKYGVEDCMIIEHGFHTNPYDAQWLLSDNNLNKLANTTVDAICDFYHITKPKEKKKDYIKGDVNNDGAINVNDITALLNILAGVVFDEEGFADINDDGTINIKDLTQLNDLIVKSMPDTYPPTEPYIKPRPDTYPPTEPYKKSKPDTYPSTDPQTEPSLEITLAAFNLLTKLVKENKYIKKFDYNKDNKLNNKDILLLQSLLADIGIYTDTIYNTSNIMDTYPPTDDTNPPIDIKTLTGPGGRDPRYYPYEIICDTDHCIQDADLPLQEGDRGKEVEYLQTRLNILGCTDTAGNPLVVDGIFGSKTKQAVMDFQANFSDTLTGIVDKNTYNKLF